MHAAATQHVAHNARASMPPQLDKQLTVFNERSLLLPRRAFLLASERADRSGLIFVLFISTRLVSTLPKPFRQVLAIPYFNPGV
jgi:hypothetical protein